MSFFPGLSPIADAITVYVLLALFLLGFHSKKKIGSVKVRHVTGVIFSVFVVFVGVLFC